MQPWAAFRGRGRSAPRVPASLRGGPGGQGKPLELGLEEIPDALDLPVAEAVADTAVQVQPELHRQDLVVGTQPVAPAPCLEQRQVDLVVGAAEHLPGRDLSSDVWPSLA